MLKLALGFAALALLAAGCGAGGSSLSVARLGTTTTTTAQPSAAARQNGVLYASCMRAHGVADFPEPVPGSGFHVPVGVKHEPQFQSASQACESDLPGGGASAKHVNIQEELNFARCMRSHGIADFPDPMTGGGFDIPGDTNSPQFEAAAHSCQTTGIHWNGPP